MQSAVLPLNGFEIEEVIFGFVPIGAKAKPTTQASLVVDECFKFVINELSNFFLIPLNRFSLVI